MSFIDPHHLPNEYSHKNYQWNLTFGYFFLCCFFIPFEYPLPVQPFLPFSSNSYLSLNSTHHSSLEYLPEWPEWGDLSLSHSYYNIYHTRLNPIVILITNHSIVLEKTFKLDFINKIEYQLLLKLICMERKYQHGRKDSI